MNSPRRLVLCSVLLLAPVASGSGEHWPRFRGPNGTGLSNATTIPVKWTEKDYNWKTKLPGRGHSSPVVWGNRIFLTCADRKTAKRIVCGLSAATGKLLWQREYESTPYRHHRDNSFASATPALDAQRVYVTWTTPKEVTLLALTHDGKDVWRRNLGTFDAMHGSGASPIVFDGLVVLANDHRATSSLVAVDGATGKTRWSVARKSGNAACSTPCIYRPADGPPELIFTSTASGIASVDPKTGTVNWELKGAFEPNRCVSSPAVAAGRIIGSAGMHGRGRAFIVVQPGSKKGNRPARVAYRLDKAIPYVVTPIAVGDLLFVWNDDGTVTCLRGATGQQIWRQKVRGSFYASPVCVDGRLYCTTRQGEVVVIAAGDKFELLARNPLGEGSYATAAIAGGRMYLRTFTHLISIGGK